MAINSFAFFNIFIHSSLLIPSTIFFLNFYLGVSYDTIVTIDHSYCCGVYMGRV